MTAKLSDEVFTEPEKAKSLLRSIVDSHTADFTNITYGIEPSAGDGAFVDAMKDLFEVIAMDIKPMRADIKKIDWLTYKPRSNITRTNSVCIGNPPFSIVGPFLKKCARVTDRILMILPRRFFTSAIPKTTLPLDWVVVHKELLETNVFRTKRKIYSSFLYLRRIDGYSRPSSNIRDSVKPIGFSLVSFPINNYKGPEPDLIIWQSGSNAGKQTKREIIGNSRAYGLLFQDIEKKERVLSSDFVIKKTQGTNNRSYVTTFDIYEAINPI